MTIILTIADDESPIHLLSDILLTVDGSSGFSIQLPHLSSSANVRMGDSTLAGLSQKMVVAGRTAFVWAGIRDAAYAIMREFFARSENGAKYISLRGVINSSGLSTYEKENVAFMTFYCDRPDNIVTCGHNIWHYDVNLRPGALGRISTVGSGSKDFVENYKASRTGSVKYSLPADIIHRMTVRTIEPFMRNNETFEHRYGSWFELSVHDGETFSKLAIAIKFWVRSSKSDKYDEFGPLVFSQYVNNDLFITTVGLPQAGTNCQIIKVPDPLARGSSGSDWNAEQVAAALQFSPDLFTHVLIDIDPDGFATTRICPFFINGDPLLVVEPQFQPDGNATAIVKMSPTLTDFINSIEGEAELTLEGWRRDE